MSSTNLITLADLGSLPFYVGEFDRPSNGELPDTLPFKVGYRSDIDLVVQVPDETVEQHLNEAYKKGSIVGTPMSEDGIGRRYADDFLGFIGRAMSSVKDLHVLEVGGGTGYLLYRLQQMGAKVLGVEPGEHGQHGAQKYGVDIIRGLFPCDEVSSKTFDAIINFTVLEHLIDPASFLDEQRRLLTDTGVIIFAVPDCTEHIEAGDVAMFIHEHWSYFSPSSIQALVESIGMRLLSLERAGFGGCLYAVAGKSGHSINVAGQTNRMDLFRTRLDDSLKRMKEFFQHTERERASVGVFCAARFFNLLHLISPNNPPRFFDDDPRLHGKYYPPINIPVESRAALIENPVDELLIWSRSFGEKLKTDLAREKSLRHTRMRLTNEFSDERSEGTSGA
jgi:2-polyprenyl-3-methyl-5-hydroxy-6-metoxy-1,4-benzoquinol methylase